MTQDDRKGDGRDRIVQVLSVRGKGAWRKWLEDYANSLGISTSDVIDQALAEHAQKRGVSPPPDRKN